MAIREEESPATEILTTYISSSTDEVYERDFLLEQTRTAGSYFRQPSEVQAHWETWRRVALFLQYKYGYDLALIRFYEDIIAELQRELARYKEMVAELLPHRRPSTESEYSRGEVAALPHELARKMRSKTPPGSPMVGYEI